MQRVFLSVRLTMLAAITLTSLWGQQRPASVVGVWRLVEVTSTGPNANTNKNPQPSLYIFTAKHYSQMSVSGDKPRPAMDQAAQAKATADQLRATWGPFFANAGTYEIKGGELIRRAVVAKNPGVMASGNFSTSSFKLEGNTLTLTTKSTNTGPTPNPTTVKLERVE
jgi:hypothetical protein